jgi:hypothetical protein
MNIQASQQALSKAELERMVLANIRMLPGSQHVQRVSVAPRANAGRNWTVLEIEPPLTTRADGEIRNVISALQAEFRLAAEEA